MFGKLYIVATPIGNLDDVTYRAIKILNDVDIILAEDTRVTTKLLKNYNIPTPLVSYHQHSSPDKKQDIYELLVEGKNIALVSDAGTPGISDPGNELIEYVREREGDIEIIPIPGPSSITAALSISGFPSGRFVFLGFLPKKKRDKLFNWLEGEKSSGIGGGITFAYFESPYRLVKSLILIKEHFGPQTQVFIAREISKIYETKYFGTVKYLIDKLEKERIKGEIVVVVKP